MKHSPCSTHYWVFCLELASLTVKIDPVNARLSTTTNLMVLCMFVTDCIYMTALMISCMLGDSIGITGYKPVL